MGKIFEDKAPVAKAITVPATGTALVPVGLGFIDLGATTILEVRTADTPTWVAVALTAADNVFYISDGFNTRMNNSGGGGVVSTVFKMSDL